MFWFTIFKNLVQNTNIALPMISYRVIKQRDLGSLKSQMPNNIIQDT